MAAYVTTADALVALNSPIPFSSVSIPCNSGNVVPLATGVLNLRGSNTNRFARYNVRVQANVQIPAGGAVTPIALGIALNGAILPESVAIVTPLRSNSRGRVRKSDCGGESFGASFPMHPSDFPPTFQAFGISSLIDGLCKRTTSFFVSLFVCHYGAATTPTTIPSRSECAAF